MSAVLVMVLCLVGAPASCHDERAPVSISLGECLTRGEIIAASIIADRPKWTLKGWKCQIGERGRQA